MRRLAYGSAVAALAVIAAAAPQTPALAASSSIQGVVLVENSSGGVEAPDAWDVYVSAREVGTPGGTSTPYGAYAQPGGAFSFEVPPGHYQVQYFVIPGATHDGAVALWYGGTPYQSAAQVVTVGSDAVSGVDITLPWGSTLSGTIHPPAGSDPPYRWAVVAYLVDPADGTIGSSSYATANSSGNYTLDGLAAGDYLLRYFDYETLDPEFDEQLWLEAEGLLDATLVSVPADTNLAGFDVHLTDDGPLFVGRLSGDDRIATAISVSQALYGDGDAEVVYLANGFNYPDGLSAGPAAAVNGGPVLLTAANSIRADLIAEIDRLAPETIVVVGGTGAVSAASEQQLVSRYGAGSVIRLGGSTRYETSVLIAQHAFPSGASTAFVASGANFPDALAAGPAAAYRGGPVVLVSGSGGLDVGVGDLLDELGVRTVLVAGGEASVPASVEAGLRSLPGVLGVQRFGGSDRYETANLINQYVFRYSDTAFLAAGTDFPDALAGSAAAGAVGAPIYLTRRDCLPTGVYARWRDQGGTLMVTLGGEGVVSESAYLLIDC